MAGSNGKSASEERLAAARVYAVLAAPMVGLLVFAAVILATAFDQRRYGAATERAVRLATEGSALAPEL